MPADRAHPEAPAASRDRLWLEPADGDLLGRRVSAWLAMHRIQASQLARAAGTDRSGLSRALHGKSPFPVILALRVCQYTGLDITGDSVTFEPRHAKHARRAPADHPEGDW
jgi:transcriptional regulator with XRE-family HTH domain